MNAWKAACASSGDVTIVIPQGIYELGPVKFTGPCKNVHTITVNLQVIEPHAAIHAEDKTKFLSQRID